jgi:hypothetical protein
MFLGERGDAPLPRAVIDITDLVIGHGPRAARTRALPAAADRLFAGQLRHHYGISVGTRRHHRREVTARRAFAGGKLQQCRRPTVGAGSGGQAIAIIAVSRLQAGAVIVGTDPRPRQRRGCATRLTIAHSGLPTYLRPEMRFSLHSARAASQARRTSFSQVRLD